MIKINSVFELADLIEKDNSLNHQRKTIILIGGCARVGKSTLSKRLNQLLKDRNLMSQVISLDSWLISHDKRKPGSKVIDRYHTKNMISALMDLYNGNVIYPPLYDSITRIQLSEIGPKPVSFKSGVLIVEGVIVLALNELTKLASIKIHLDINNCKRLRRLIEFYKVTKKISANEYKQLIKAREKEEVPYIRSISQNADIIYSSR